MDKRLVGLLAKRDQLEAECQAFVARSDDTLIPELTNCIGELQRSSLDGIAGRWDAIIGTFAAVGLVHVLTLKALDNEKGDPA